MPDITRDEELAEAFADLERLSDGAERAAADLRDLVRQDSFSRPSLEQSAQEFRDIGRSVAELAKWIDTTLKDPAGYGGVSDG